MRSALVIGGAENVLAEAQAALVLFPQGRPDAVLVVNDTIPLWPDRVTHLCSLHPAKLMGWLETRRARGFQIDGAAVCCNRRINSFGTEYAFIDRVCQDWLGSSGLFAVTCALFDGCDRIVLAGVPMDVRAGHVTRHRPWLMAPLYQKAWRNYLPQIVDKVRSCSGWTRELLGAPTMEWVSSYN